MTRPQATTRGAIFDLAAIEAEMRTEPAYERNGHTARTLVREPDLRVVLVAMKEGGRIAEHGANDTASIHTLRGHLRLALGDSVAELPRGQVLVLERGLRHDVEAVTESAFLLTLAWQGKES